MLLGFSWPLKSKHLKGMNVVIQVGPTLAPCAGISALNSCACGGTPLFQIFWNRAWAEVEARKIEHEQRCAPRCGKGQITV